MFAFGRLWNFFTRSRPGPSRGDEGETTAELASRNSGIAKDRTRARLLRVPLNLDAVPADTLRTARQAASNAFEAAHGALTLNRERKLLMRRPNDVNSTLSASDVQYRELRAEATIPGCLFRDMMWDNQMEYMRSLKATVSRSVIEESREIIRHFFVRFIKDRAQESEQHMVLGYLQFLREATKILAGGDFERSVEIKLNGLSAAGGVLAKHKPGSNDVDPDAGYRGETDFVIPFGHKSYGGKTLLAGEAKFFRKRPNMTRPWYQLISNHLPDLMVSIVGQLPAFAVATCNFGIKTFAVQHTSEGTSSLSVSPPGDCYLDFREEGAWEKVFDWWLEIAALAVPPPNDARMAGTKKLKVAVVEFGDALSGKSPRKRQRSRSPEPKSPKRIGISSTTGFVVEFTSIDLEAILTPDELWQLKETCLRERKEAEERERASSTQMTAGDLPN